MKKKGLLFLLVAISSFVFFSQTFGAESFDAYDQPVYNSSTLVDVYISWTTAADGSFTAVALSSKEYFDNPYPVYVQFIYTDPTDTPTDNYDLSFVSSEFSGVDIFGQAAYDRDDTNSEIAQPIVGYVAVDLNKVTFDVLNAGISKSGTVRLRCIRAN